MHLHMQKQVKV